jgi:hypothetical protein
MVRMGKGAWSDAEEAALREGAVRAVRVARRASNTP